MPSLASWRSLRMRLGALCALSLVACAAVALLLLGLWQESSRAQIGRAEAVVAHACDLIADRWRFYSAAWAGPSAEERGAGIVDARTRADLAGLVGVALERQTGVEGGVWQSGAGPLAYAFPTYEGTGPKTDLPEAERSRIEAVNAQAARDEQAADARQTSSSQTLLLHACPLDGPIPGLTAWTMTRVHAVQGLDALRLGLGLLLALMVGMTAWVARILVLWSRHVARIQAALGGASPAGTPPTALPPVPRTGERELDQLVDALNHAGRRLAQAQRDAEAAAARAAQAERLAGLGRVAAGVAHEIRNPIAAARLQGENALAGDDRRRQAAIADMLEQLARLDRLVTELLAMTQRPQPAPRRVDLPAFLAAHAAEVERASPEPPVQVHVHAQGDAWLDPAVIGRVLDNLLTNAVRHARPGGAVTLTAEHHQDRLRLTVADDGAGVAPALAPHLFEPFVTGRPDGIGLGLAIARELSEAHGGRLALEEGPGGATFVLDLPQEPEQHAEPACPPS